VCQAVLPEEKEKLDDAVDFAHRVGKLGQDNRKPRGVIMRFISGRFRDAVWKAARSSSYLQSEGLASQRTELRRTEKTDQTVASHVDKARFSGNHGNNNK